MSGLPGSGYGVTVDGRVDIRGAMSFSTPIAYSLRGYEVVFGASNISDTGRFKFALGESAGSPGVGNGTGQIVFGVPLPESWGHVTFSHMMLSKLLDNAQNLQWTPPNQSGPVRYAIGVQDIGGQGGTSGEGIPGDLGSSRTYYAVATYEATPETHVSIGIGDTRYRGRPFGNASHSVTDRLKLTIEWDVFNINYAVAYDLGPLVRDVVGERDARATVQVGMVRSKYAFWSINFHF